MGDLIRFVDSISATPTVRLDLNDEANGWAVSSFSAPPPRLRRSVAANSMRDGITVGSSTYDGRTVTIGLDIIKGLQDIAAAELQKLARELDRETNFLEYRPSGATKSVFFRTFRADVAQLQDVIAQAAFRQALVEIPAEPFALGLKETLSPGTVSNDPSAANGHYVDITGVIGDVPAPCLIRDPGSHQPGGYLAMRQHGTPSSATYVIQAESNPGGTDTTNPGGGPDAAMSGTGTNNFLRTTFATDATMIARWGGSVAGAVDRNGSYRVLAVVRRSDATSVINARISWSVRSTTTVGATVAIPASTSRQVIDLGVFSLGVDMVEGGYGGALRTLLNQYSVEAQRVSGAGSIDWDYLALVPADESLLIFRKKDSSGFSPGDLVIDSVNESVHKRDNLVGSAIASDLFDVAGGFPMLVPNQTNRLVYVIANMYATPFTISKTETAALALEYYPRYLHVRPVAS